MATYDINNRPSRLAYGDEITFQVEEKTYKTHVTSYRISRLSGGMDYGPLEVIGLKNRKERMEFATAAYGYEANGACFPECRRDDYPALTRLANAIFDRIQGLNGYDINNRPKLLRKGDKVTFTHGENQYIYFVEFDHLSTEKNNAIIFNKLGIRPEALALEAYGYSTNSGVWPNSHHMDYGALTRLVNAIFDRIQNSDVETETTPVNTFKVGDPVKLKGNTVEMASVISRCHIDADEFGYPWVVSGKDEDATENIHVSTVRTGDDGERNEVAVGWFNAHELELVEVERAFVVGDPVKLKMKGVDGETLMATIRREIVSKVELDRRWIVTDTDESPERNIEVATMDEDGGEDGEHVGWFSASELELVEAAEVRPFKAKDRVKVVSDRLGNRMGKLGTVEYDDMAESVPFRVQMDEDGETIWFDANELELVTEEAQEEHISFDAALAVVLDGIPETFRASVGDLVRACLLSREANG